MEVSFLTALISAKVRLHLISTEFVLLHGMKKSTLDFSKMLHYMLYLDYFRPLIFLYTSPHGPTRSVLITTIFPLIMA